MKRYWNYNSYLPETKGIQTRNETSTIDQLARATDDLVEILQELHSASPFLQQGTVINDAIKQSTGFKLLPH